MEKLYDSIPSIFQNHPTSHSHSLSNSPSRTLPNSAVTAGQKDSKPSVDRSASVPVCKTKRKCPFLCDPTADDNVVRILYNNDYDKFCDSMEVFLDSFNEG